MSANDLIALGANYDEWLEERGPEIEHPFVYYCVEQFLKPYVPTDEDIEYGITDGPNDGGVDGIYFLIDRDEFIRDDSNTSGRKPIKVSLLIFQVKSGPGSGFQMTEIDKLYHFTNDLLDLTRSAEKPPLSDKYHLDLRTIMQTFKDDYRSFSNPNIDLSINYFYITKADELAPDAKAKESANRVKQAAQTQMSQSAISFNFVNAQRLLEQVRARVSKDRQLNWQPQPMVADEGTIGLVRLVDLYDFLCEPDGTLASRVFESNVRGFQEETPVNIQIRRSVRDVNQPANFWLLNNGITIITERLSTAGQLTYKCEDPQIVNGLQSSRAIFEFFQAGGDKNDSRCVLVRLIRTDDEKVRDSIIRATNSQNKMEPASLRATDSIHRDIEDVMRKFGLYYDRRKGHHKDNGIPARSIISIPELTKAVVSVFLQRPDNARARIGTYFARESDYAEVFGEPLDDGWKAPLPLVAYVKCAQVARLVDAYLKERRKEDESLRGHEANLKFHMSMYVACAVLKTARPTPRALNGLKVGKINDAVVTDAFNRVRHWYDKLGATNTVAKGPNLRKKLISNQIIRRFGKK